jgi:hypothetical protein
MTERGFIDGEYQDGELRGCTFIAGIRGMGKTTEMARLLDQCLGGALFFDSLSRHEHVIKGARIITQPGELSEYLRINRGRRFRVLYQPRSGDMDGHFRSVCQLVRAHGWMIFAVDELDMLCGSRWGDKRMPPEFNHLVHYGRHERVSMLATARRPMDVARGFTSQCAEMRLFRMTEQADLKYFEAYIGRADAERLSTLQKYQYLHYTGDGEAKLCGEKRGSSTIGYCGAGK